MKYFLLEPTYKKSVIEWTVFRRENEDGKPIFLRKEIGWRWGTWMISVPETEEEALQYIKDDGYEDVLDWAEGWGYTITDDNGEEALDPDLSLVEMVTQRLMPSEDEECITITEDYSDAEMIDIWDGCWEYWSVDSPVIELDEEETKSWCEEAEAAFDEEYEEGVEALGWVYLDTMYEMHCNPKITPCDENGTPLEDAA